jgi:alkaline phosphatase
MKYYLASLLLSISLFLKAQPLIHAHNDYQQPEPLMNALRNKAFSIEADIFMAGDSLLVAHDKKELPSAPSLMKLYLQPIIALFNRHHGRASASKHYAPVLMIDIKENGEAVIAQLIKQLALYPGVFDRAVNPMAVQVVISGERGPVNKWAAYPSFIFFDGRPYEVYDSTTMQRVAFVSDAYANYTAATDSSHSRLQALVNKVHGMGKLLRVWGSPDDPASWKQQQQSSIDIINTNEVGECRRFFNKQKKMPGSKSDGK